MAELNVATEEVEDEMVQVNLRISRAKRADLMSRAGAIQAELGEKVSVQSYIELVLWPNGLPSAA